MSQLFFEHLTDKYPDYSEQCKLMVDLKEKKLYYQLTKEVETFVNDKFLRKQQVFEEFYETFLKDIQKKINPIHLVQIIIAICKQFTDYSKPIHLVEGIVPDVESDLGARCLCYSTIGYYKLLNNDKQGARDEMDKVNTLIEHEEGLEAIVYCQYYLLCTTFYEFKNDPNEYFIYGAKYLKFVDQSVMELDDKIKFVTKIIISALVGNKVYNFGEFLNNPICESVAEEPKIGKLVVLLRAINNGNMDQFTEVLNQLSDLFESDQALKTNRIQIIEKASIVSLMEMVFRTVAEKRTFTFEQISKVTHVQINNVEMLIMKTLSLGLVKGYISQTTSEATFTWVLPRILDKSQFGFVTEKLKEWTNMTNITLNLMENADFIN